MTWYGYWIFRSIRRDHFIFHYITYRFHRVYALFNLTYTHKHTRTHYCIVFTILDKWTIVRYSNNSILTYKRTDWIKMDRKHREVKSKKPRMSGVGILVGGRADFVRVGPFFIFIKRCDGREKKALNINHIFTNTLSKLKRLGPLFIIN